MLLLPAHTVSWREELTKKRKKKKEKKKRGNFEISVGDIHCGVRERAAKREEEERVREEASGEAVFVGG